MVLTRTSDPIQLAGGGGGRREYTRGISAQHYIFVISLSLTAVVWELNTLTLFVVTQNESTTTPRSTML